MQALLCSKRKNLDSYFQTELLDNIYPLQQPMISTHIIITTNPQSSPSVLHQNILKSVLALALFSKFQQILPVIRKERPVQFKNSIMHKDRTSRINYIAFHQDCTSLAAVASNGYAFRVDLPTNQSLKAKVSFLDHRKGYFPGGIKRKSEFSAEYTQTIDFIAGTQDSSFSQSSSDEKAIQTLMKSTKP